ncbi:MAG: hypothetical protein ACRDGL_08290, partial [Candidatus Limnocylindrales bacterium]
SGSDEASLQVAAADQSQELARRQRELAGTRARLAAAEARLADPRFVDRAPADVVERARRLVAELRAEIEHSISQAGG